MKNIFIFLITLIVFPQIVSAQSYPERVQTSDILHYKLNIELNDETNNIEATMEVSMQYKTSINWFILDLENKDETTGEGMEVISVHQNSVLVDYKHENDRIVITPKHNFANLTYTYVIKYKGIPSTGLIIGKNKFGDRTFFGDNWPNRAHSWFPCVDHPIEKASIEYIVEAPNHYKVIANGVLVEETDLENNLKQTHWITPNQLSTKVMVIGVANFETELVTEIDSIPISTWVYPQSKEAGFHDFAVAEKILPFFIELVGEYPFKKLANVQSTTQYGGMENASAIFYDENGVTGERQNENVVAHEIAHQWFGNSATEIDWPHVWLSEGFATYFTDLYVEKTKGDSIFQNRMVQERNRVFKFYENTKTPIVDTKTTNYMKLLNPNSYQKGAWVLHMLRNELGDETFFKGIRAYYDKYKYRNASTNNFKNVMAGVSGKNLDQFFKQWLYSSEFPIIKSNWIYYNNKVRLMLDQTQETAFEFPLDVKLIYTDGTSEIKKIKVTYKTEPFVIECEGEVKELQFDPNNWLFFQLAKE